MRPLKTLAAALLLVLGLGAIQPVAAFDEGHRRYHAYPGITIEHHVYVAPRFRHAYYVYGPIKGPRKAKFRVDESSRWGWVRPEWPRVGGYFSPRYEYRRASWLW